MWAKDEIVDEGTAQFTSDDVSHPPAVTQVHVPANVGRRLSYHIASRATTIMRIATEGDPIHF
jgi:hypothetical protein